jgi:hypothetical protein
MKQTSNGGRLIIDSSDQSQQPSIPLEKVVPWSYF